MKNSEEFYQFIDNTTLSNVITNLITIANLNGFNTSVNESNNIIYASPLWSLYLYKEKLEYMIRIWHTNNIPYKYALDIGKGFNGDTDYYNNSLQFIELLKKLIEDI